MIPPRLRRLLFLAAVTLTLPAGCAVVQPWERGLLNSRLLADPPDPLAAMIDGHIDGARESMLGADGGHDACGCN